MLPKNYIPAKPFPDFKWKWASLQLSHTEQNTEQDNRVIETFGTLKAGPFPFEVRKRL